MARNKYNKTYILEILKNVLNEHFGNNIRDIILFGSHAKGIATEYSDYDILILLNNDYDWRFRDKMTDVMYDLELKYDILFDKHLLSVNEIKNSIKGMEPIYINAIKNGIYA